MAVALLWLLVLTGVQKLGPNGLTKTLALSSTTSLSWNPMRMGKALGCAGAFTGMLATGNLCLMFVQVSFYQVRMANQIPLTGSRCIGEACTWLGHVAGEALQSHASTPAYSG